MTEKYFREMCHYYRRTIGWLLGIIFVLALALAGTWWWLIIRAAAR